MSNAPPEFCSGEKFRTGPGNSLVSVALLLCVAPSGARRRTARAVGSPPGSEMVQLAPPQGEVSTASAGQAESPGILNFSVRHFASTAEFQEKSQVFPQSRAEDWLPWKTSSPWGSRVGLRPATFS